MNGGFDGEETRDPLMSRMASSRAGYASSIWDIFHLNSIHTTFGSSSMLSAWQVQLLNSATATTVGMHSLIWDPRFFRRVSRSDITLQTSLYASFPPWSAIRSSMGLAAISIVMNVLHKMIHGSCKAIEVWYNAERNSNASRGRFLCKLHAMHL